MREAHGARLPHQSCRSLPAVAGARWRSMPDPRRGSRSLRSQHPVDPKAIARPGVRLCLELGQARQQPGSVAAAHLMLEAKIATELAQARAAAQASGRPARCFKDFLWSTLV